MYGPGVILIGHQWAAAVALQKRTGFHNEANNSSHLARIASLRTRAHPLRIVAGAAVHLRALFAVAHGDYGVEQYVRGGTAS